MPRGRTHRQAPLAFHLSSKLVVMSDHGDRVELREPKYGGAGHGFAGWEASISRAQLVLPHDTKDSAAFMLRVVRGITRLYQERTSGMQRHSAHLATQRLRHGLRRAKDLFWTGAVTTAEMLEKLPLQEEVYALGLAATYFQLPASIPDSFRAMGLDEWARVPEPAPDARSGMLVGAQAGAMVVSGDVEEVGGEAAGFGCRDASVRGGALGGRRSARYRGRDIARYNYDDDDDELSSEDERFNTYDDDILPGAPGDHESDGDDIYEAGEDDNPGTAEGNIHGTEQDGTHNPDEDKVRVTFDQVVSIVSDHGISLKAYSSRLWANEELATLAKTETTNAQARLEFLENEHETLIVAYNLMNDELRAEVERHEAARKEGKARLGKIEAACKEDKIRLGKLEAARREDGSRVQKLEADIEWYKATHSESMARMERLEVAHREDKSKVEKLEADVERYEVTHREDKARMEKMEADARRHEVMRKEDRARLKDVIDMIALLSDRVESAGYGRDSAPVRHDDKVSVAEAPKTMVAEARSAGTSSTAGLRGDKRKRAVADDGCKDTSTRISAVPRLSSGKSLAVPNPFSGGSLPPLGGVSLELFGPFGRDVVQPTPRSQTRPADGLGPRVPTGQLSAMVAPDIARQFQCRGG